MNVFDMWLKGATLGFAIAAPVGPIGLLCIRRTLAGGRTQGILSGLGAASADLIYASLATFGLKLVVEVLTGQAVWIRMGGGVLLAALGIRICLTRPPAEMSQPGGLNGLGAYASTFLLTISNPATILSYIALFSGLTLPHGSDKLTPAILLVCGVFCGSCVWWLALASLVNPLHARLNQTTMLWVNRVSGALLSILGLVYVFSH